MSELDEQERLLKTSQVLFRLSCSKTYLDKLVREGKLKPMLDGNRYKFSSKEIQAYIERKKRERDNDKHSSGTVFLNFILR